MRSSSNSSSNSSDGLVYRAFTADRQLDADYLVIGCGAMAMAFVDQILSETDSSVIIVDRDAKPGGHWQHAYPFVKLHQPALFYGVNSRKLGNGDVSDLSSGQEVMSYFEQVMSDWLNLPSERCRFFPRCVWTPAKPMQFTSVDLSISYAVNVRRKVVDATYLRAEIPAMHFRQESEVKPLYDVHAVMEAHHVPLNLLPEYVPGAHADYVVIGGGKTGIDAVLWLLDRGAAPENVKWVVSSDPWLIMRHVLTNPFALQKLGHPERIYEAAPDILLSCLPCVLSCFPCLRSLSGKQFTFEFVLAKFEEEGVIKRLENGVSPGNYKCATVSVEEYEQLQRIVQCGNVVRLGKVKVITDTHIVLEHGIIPTSSATLHVDCSTTGLQRATPTPVFESDRIVLQSLFYCQPTFSGALIGHVETRCGHDLSVKECNRFCAPCPHPAKTVDGLQAIIISICNLHTWSSDLETAAWLSQARLWLGATQNIEKAKTDAAKQFGKPVRPLEEVADDILGSVYNDIPINHIREILKIAQPEYSNLIDRAIDEMWFADASETALMCGWPESEQRKVWECLETYEGGLVQALKQRERAGRCAWFKCFSGMRCASDPLPSDEPSSDDDSCASSSIRQ